MKFSMKALRVNAGFTLEEASKKLGISRVTLRNYETNKTKPNIELLDSILKLYNAKFSNLEYVFDNDKVFFIDSLQTNNND